MKKNILLLLIPTIILTVCCAGRPKYFTNYYTGEYTGLDTLINTKGIYLSQRINDSSRFSMIMFYNNGIFASGDNYSIISVVIDCFDGSMGKCEGLVWGSYKIVKDTIKTQQLWDEGVYGKYIIYRDYFILSDRKILLISDYMLEDNKKAYLNKYKYRKNPLYLFENVPPCRFYPLETKRDSTQCPLLKKKWFWKKGFFPKK